MTKAEWERKTGEKVRDGGILWEDTWCTIEVYMVQEPDGPHLWKYNRWTKTFTDEKQVLTDTE